MVRKTLWTKIVFLSTFQSTREMTPSNSLFMFFPKRNKAWLKNSDAPFAGSAPVGLGLISTCHVWMGWREINRQILYTSKLVLTSRCAHLVAAASFDTGAYVGFYGRVLRGQAKKISNQGWMEDALWLRGEVGEISRKKTTKQVISSLWKKVTLLRCRRITK